MNWDAIRIEFEETDITMKDLAEKHGIKPATLRSRKNREKWEKRNATKKGATQRKKNATKPRNVATQKAEKIIKDNDDLLGWELAFCYEYVKEFNATKAYLAVKDVTYNTASTEGMRTLRKPYIQKAIADIKRETSSKLFVEVEDITRQWMKQAFADINDFVEYGSNVIQVKDKFGNPLVNDKGELVTYKDSFINFKDMNEIDGSLIQEVKMGKDGPIIKLYDKQRALTELEKRIGGENNLKLKLLKAQIDKVMQDTTVDTSTEDKLKDFFSKLGAEIDATD